MSTHQRPQFQGPYNQGPQRPTHQCNNRPCPICDVVEPPEPRCVTCGNPAHRYSLSLCATHLFEASCMGWMGFDRIAPPTYHDVALASYRACNQLPQNNIPYGTYTQPPQNNVLHGAYQQPRMNDVPSTYETTEIARGAQMAEQTHPDLGQASGDSTQARDQSAITGGQDQIQDTLPQSSDVETSSDDEKVTDDETIVGDNEETFSDGDTIVGDEDLGISIEAAYILLGLRDYYSSDSDTFWFD
ncbi:hypothetical protein GGR54DRAFT_591565 [Hypoxylon sp. NC1633]|nr:hypothetical protein GGR54DRAFT_591565 [Hypoxylon sp. NC1633]